MSRPIVTDTGIELRPDASRVVARLFVPGREDIAPGESRAGPVIERVLALSDSAVRRTAKEVRRSFAHRHDHFLAMIEDHVAQIATRLDPTKPLSEDRRFLLGACFTQEYAVEAAALCNPSIVLHPDPTTPSSEDPSGATGDARFVLSVRGIGEGHRSSIGFRTGAVTAAGSVSIDAPSPHVANPRLEPAVHHRSLAHLHLVGCEGGTENIAFVLAMLPESFDDAQLEAAVTALIADGLTRSEIDATVTRLRDFARASYRVSFRMDSDLSSRVLSPNSPHESHGMEDARFVRFVDDYGTVTYYATYTGWDGFWTHQHMLETTDFVHFAVSPVGGPAAIGKGLALFPRMVQGRYVALSRSDRETNGVSFSDDPRCWTNRHIVQMPERPWELLQLGNCGSPIETSAGWLVLTHGVGPFREYHIGALLLDLEDPTKLLAYSQEPVLSPNELDRDGYVPNVVYTCGALAHRDTLVLPFGIADQAIGIATLSLDDLLGCLSPSRRSRRP